ncbi:4-hydroxy-3-methylbut-2-enyl diphosphate reductase [Chloroflexota bacterium]
MEIEKAAEMGFCFGVRRAIELVERAARERGSLQSLGALVHNKQVVDSLARQGVGVAESLDEIQSNIVAIASHGAGPEVIDMVKAKGLEFVDATCPFVRKAQVIAQGLAKDGFSVLVFGDASHSEVQGVLSWADGKGSASLEVPKHLPQRLGVLSQTTQSEANFKRFLAGIVSLDLAKGAELRIFNTLCDATRKQQVAALDLAGRVDLMVVIGGKHSANTRRIAEVCATNGVETRHIEIADELDPSLFRGRHRVGVAAGTSTPDEIIDEVMVKIEEIAKEIQS